MLRQNLLEQIVSQVYHLIHVRNTICVVLVSAEDNFQISHFSGLFSVNMLPWKTVAYVGSRQQGNSQNSNQLKTFFFDMNQH